MREGVEDIRKRIEKIDHEILRMMANRTAAAVEMGQMKAAEGLPLRAPAVEETVVARYVERAKEFGMSAASAREIAALLIHESVEQQGRVPRPAASRRVLVIGGNGKMGGWLCRFLAARGHKIKICDRGDNDLFPVERDLEKGVEDAEIIVLAVPISAAGDLLKSVLALRPPALVFDIASVKAPLIGTLRKAAAEGLQVCSVHPMFGPETSSIIDRNVVVCDCGSSSAADRARTLLDGANLISMEVEEHDPVMAYVLGLSHAVNIVFAEALNRSGKSYRDLERAASTTFRRQAGTAKGVASENVQLYYEIQHLNPYNREALAHLQRAVDDLKRSAEKGDREAFGRMMKEGKEYFRGD